MTADFYINTGEEASGKPDRGEATKAKWQRVFETELHDPPLFRIGIQPVLLTENKRHTSAHGWQCTCSHFFVICLPPQLTGNAGEAASNQRMIDDPEIYRTVLQRLSAGVYFVDRGQHIVFWNRGAEEITGYLSQQVLGHHMAENFLEHVNQENRQLEGDDLPLNAVLRNGKEIEERATIRHKDGYPIRVLVRAIPLRDEFGKLLGAAEFIEPTEPLLWQDDRKNELAMHGCMDRSSGALTREYMETQLHEHIETFERHRIPFSVLVMQADHLDDLRVKHGSGAVAAVMRVVAQTLLNGLRTPDLLGRWTDTEYLVVAAECGEADAPRIVERLRKSVAGAETQWWGDRLTVTLSAGAAAVKPGDNAAKVVERAETGLRKAIADGGNRSAIQYE